MEQASLQLTPRHRRMLRELEGGTAAQQPRREARSQRRVSRLAVVGSLFAICSLGLVWSGGGPQGTHAVTSLPMAASGSAVLTPVAFDVLPRSPVERLSTGNDGPATSRSAHGDGSASVPLR